MSGAIIPEPLAKPLMVISVSPIRARCAASLGKLSLVRMPPAPPAQLPAETASPALASRTPAIGARAGTVAGASGETGAAFEGLLISTAAGSVLRRQG